MVGQLTGWNMFVGFILYSMSVTCIKKAVTEKLSIQCYRKLWRNRTE